MTILIYTRVSTTDQSVASQLSEIRPYVAARGWVVAGEFTDKASGTRARRDGLDEMLERVALGGIDAIVVYKLDRLGRSIINVVELVKALAAEGVAVIAITQGIDTREGSPTGRMVLNLMAVFAEFERDMIRERTVAGLNAAKMRGKVLGKPSRFWRCPDKWAGQIAAWEDVGRRDGVRGLAKIIGCCPSTACKILAAVRGGTVPEVGAKSYRIVPRVEPPRAPVLPPGMPPEVLPAKTVNDDEFVE
jgi:DNA invertase Pin-like site-specific DNA recombinase